MATRTKRRAPATRRDTPRRRTTAPAARHAAPSRDRRVRASAPPRHHRRELWGLGAIAVGVILASALWFGVDGGPVGGWLVRGAQWLIGVAAFGLPAALVVLGALLILRSPVTRVRAFRVGLPVLMTGLFAILGDGHGGLLGQALGGGLAALVGHVGAVAIGIALLLAGALLLTGASVGMLLRRSGHGARRAVAHAHPKLRRAVASVRRPIDDEPETAESAPAGLPPPAHGVGVLDGAAAFPDIISSRGAPRVESMVPSAFHAVQHDAYAESSAPERPINDPLGALPTQSGYRLPDRTLLHMSAPVHGDTGEASERTAAVLVETLAHFGVEAQIVGMIAGPRVVRYELELAPGTRVSKVSNLRDDLSYALATTEIRILAPIPGKQAVGVEVPNLSARLVTLGDIFGELPGTASPLAVWLGKDIAGNAVWTDLARMPHLLIAGTTGSGKSGCINTLLTSILLRSTPDEVRMILIDPKRIELGYYESIPHLLTPVVSSPKEASAVLQNLVAEMERRYERLSLLCARNLPEANRALRARGDEPLPYLLVVIDELADLMMVSPQAVEDAVIRLAQKSRAVGIHLVLATQRPSVDVITGMIKANVPSRIAFAVSSQTDSRVILDGHGAESLLGQGDMLFKPLGTSRLQRIQGAYVTEEEIALIVDQCRSQRGQQLDESLLETVDPEATHEDAGDLGFDPDEDPLLDRAIETVVMTQSASVSLLQRRLRVGYTRAGRLIDMLERRGVISGYEGSKPRRVLVEEHQLASIIGKPNR